MTFLRDFYVFFCVCTCFCSFLDFFFECFFLLLPLLANQLCSITFTLFIISNRHRKYRRFVICNRVPICFCAFRYRSSYFLNLKPYVTLLWFFFRSSTDAYDFLTLMIDKSLTNELDCYLFSFVFSDCSRRPIFCHTSPRYIFIK